MNSHSVLPQLKRIKGTLDVLYHRFGYELSKNPKYKIDPEQLELAQKLSKEMDQLLEQYQNEA